MQEYLLRICIGKSDVEADYDSDGAAKAPSRRLLAAGESTFCKDRGKEPLWSSALIHKVHILIFLIAISHVLYGMASLAISMLAMKRWRAFERTAQQGDLLDLPVDQLQKEGESRFVFGLRQAVRQFTKPIDRATYTALRRMFVETMHVRSQEPPTFRRALCSGALRSWSRVQHAAASTLFAAS